VLGLLLVAGYALSRSTLRAVASRPIDAHARPTELRLRRVYRALLVAAGAFYYVSLPLLAFVVLAATAGVIGGIIAAGWIAPKLFIILAIVAGGSILAILKSVFTRVKDEDPGSPLDLAAHPRLRDALGEVASRIGTRPIDRVFLTPFTDVAVFDRGGFFVQMRGAGERCLVVGAGVLDGMRVRAFKSVLAHEYGHFRNEDTAGGGFALSVRRSLMLMAMNLVKNGAASPLNPAWWFVRGFGRAFLGISQGASRLQEVLADRWAAFAYGSASFEEGLRHVIARDVRFDAHVGATLDEVVKTKRALPNLYAFVPSTPHASHEVERAIGETFEKPASPYDSHPRPADRLAWVHALAAPDAPATPDDDADAWSLFADRAELEAQMTAEVRDRMARMHGVLVAPA
jgi:Zn-dependent protease with chaperone function